MLNEICPLPLARVKELCDVTRCGETVVALATEVLELRKDRERLDWWLAHPNFAFCWPNPSREDIDAAMEVKP